LGNVLESEVKGMVIDAVEMALRRMNREYCNLSELDYRNLGINGLADKKYLERPFAYEFYHQLRTLMDEGKVNFGGLIIQAEVDKRYQHCFEDGKIPDFIIHKANTKENLAVIEFKLASNSKKIDRDFEKLVLFKRELRYKHLIEVIIGDNPSLERVRGRIKEMECDNGDQIVVIEFNVEGWQTQKWEIRYRSKSATQKKTEGKG
jgi:hypothetical protein